MLQAYEGYFENDRFYPIGSPVRISGRRRVVLTVLEDDTAKSQAAKTGALWAEIDRMAEESSGEDALLFDEAFSRKLSGREYTALIDGV